MAVNPIDLASMLCSRLCHDMLSPVGALSNGLELLAEEKDPEMRQRCFELLEQSARISADKLKFFRLAFGAAGGFGDMVPVQEPRALIQGLLGDSGRTQMNWAVTGSQLPKPAVKMLLNLAAIAIEALPRGGTLDVGAEQREGEQGGMTEIVVRASGPKLVLDPVIGRALNGALEPGELNSRTVAAHMLHEMAAGAGGTLQFALGEDALVLGAALPQG